MKELLRRSHTPQPEPALPSEAPDFEAEIDEIITGLYELSREERAAIGKGR